ncbi:hypothetical protein BOBR111200_08750 [Bordetella bronchialis]
MQPYPFLCPRQDLPAPWRARRAGATPIAAGMSRPGPATRVRAHDRGR